MAPTMHPTPQNTAPIVQPATDPAAAPAAAPRPTAKPCKAAVSSIAFQKLPSASQCSVERFTSYGKSVIAGFSRVVP
jgi:hypothetical protein